MSEFKPMDLFDEFTAPQPAALAPEDVPQSEHVPLPDPLEEVSQEESVQTEDLPQEDASQEEGASQTEMEMPDDGMKETLEQMAETASQISGQIEALSELFQKRILYTAHEEKIIDQMHEELQRYKEGLYAQLVRPILLDVIEVRDSILRISAAYQAKPEGEQAIPNKTFSDYAYDLQDILEKNSVEIYRSQPGDAFAPARQRVIQKVAVPEEALHGKVAESLSGGYLYNGRVLSAEKVSVYTYEKPAESEEISEVTEHG